MGDLATKGRLPYNAIGVLDGDKEDQSHGCIVLPGSEAPERMVFGELKANGWAQLLDRFGIGAGSLYQFLDDAIRAPDHHKWTELVGDRILKSKQSVWEILANQWARTCVRPDDAKRVTDEIKAAVARASERPKRQSIEVTEAVDVAAAHKEEVTSPAELSDAERPERHIYQDLFGNDP
ncbi:hypothetical protein [Lacipirellula sp.]|uniref:hypothetical protein n=1 Tax=Lacipirellula sp. TaxID=2691419 RepID=UPI003D1063F7